MQYELFDPGHVQLRWFEKQVECFDNHPVVQVNYFDCVCFGWFLGRQELVGDEYEIRLPKEVEWEYACRAGWNTPFSIKGHSGDSLESSYANFDGDRPWPENASEGPYLAHTIAVDGRWKGSVYSENDWGLIGMHGNVWEWCEDLYSERGSDRVMRGGCWDSKAASCRSASRFRFEESERSDFVGFRVSLQSVYRAK